LIDRELIDACTHCGFCLPTCPTYGPLGQMEADSPRGRIWLMRGLADGTMTANASVVEHIDRCLGCMACVTACPSGVRYDLLIEQTREVIEAEYDRPAGDWLLRTLVFSVFPHPRRLRAALALAPLAEVVPGQLRALGDLAPPWRSRERPPEVTPAVGETRGRVGLLTGCVQSVVFGDVNAATARVLSGEGFEVVTPRGQACCGALHLHAGRREEGKRRANALGDRFRAAGVDAIVVNAAGCGSHLKEAGLDVRVVDVNELLAEAEQRAKRHPLDVRVAFQDSCHLFHAQGIRVEPRELLDGVPGLERLEPPEQAICCGSAGIYNLTQPEAARELGDRKAAHVLATGAAVYASANPGCLVQVSAALRRAGRPLAALHPIELLDASLRGLSADELLATARR
jgi:glycolate dehydrogenase iron-sulfur subunit